MWDSKERVEHYAKALLESRQCTERNSEWEDPYVWAAKAEYQLIAARAKWQEKNKQQEKLEPSLQAVLDGASYSSCEATYRRGLTLNPANDYFRTCLQTLREEGYETNETQDREMRNTTAAQSRKAEGNAAYAAKKWQEGVDAYTKALEWDPLDHVFYSNRAACYAELDEFEKALKDAERCIKLNPQFAKGYYRQARALFNMGRYLAGLFAISGYPGKASGRFFGPF